MLDAPLESRMTNPEVLNIVKIPLANVIRLMDSRHPFLRANDLKQGPAGCTSNSQGCNVDGLAKPRRAKSRSVTHVHASVWSD